MAEVLLVPLFLVVADHPLHDAAGAVLAVGDRVGARAERANGVGDTPWRTQ